MSDKGWAVIDRKIQDHWLWKDKPFSKGQAWMDLVLLAKHKDQKFIYDGKLIDGKRGTVYWSLKALSERWGWDRKKTRRFVDVLEMDGMVTVNDPTDGATYGTTNRPTHGTTITIVNYGKFQDVGTTNRTTDDLQIKQPITQSRDNQGTTDGQPLPTYNNINNVNNVNNIGYGYNSTLLAEAVPSAPLPSQDDLDRIVEAWNAIPHTVRLTRLVPMTRRYDKLREALAIVGMDGVMQAIQSVKESDWMAKKGHIAFQDWITPDRVQDLIEGRYKEIFQQVQGGGYVELTRDW